MFKNPFSFEGRIRRTEFGISFIIFVIGEAVIQAIGAAIGASSSTDSGNSGVILIAFIFLIPLLVFLWAQGAKRCHDIGVSGWYQLIPLYLLWLLFAEGKIGMNQYGDDPKGIPRNNQQINVNQSTPANTGAGYQGGYSGGHNNPNFGNSDDQNKSNGGEYQSGDLYH